jgi:hypothetical protein
MGIIRGTGIPPGTEDFFVEANVKFSTNEPGRPSTFYFEDNLGNRGRYRRAHGQGEQLTYQGACRRIFISPMLKHQLGALTTGGPFEDNLNHDTYGQFIEKLSDVLVAITSNDPDGYYFGRASERAMPGWHVYETDGDNCHCSSGTVVADDTVAPFFEGGGFAGYAGNYVVWTD